MGKSWHLEVRNLPATPQLETGGAETEAQKPGSESGLLNSSHDCLKDRCIRACRVGGAQ